MIGERSGKEKVNVGEVGRRGETSGGNEYCSRTRSVWRRKKNVAERKKTADVRT